MKWKFIGYTFKAMDCMYICWGKTLALLDRKNLRGNFGKFLPFNPSYFSEN